MSIAFGPNLTMPFPKFEKTANPTSRSPTALTNQLAVAMNAPAAWATTRRDFPETFREQELKLTHQMDSLDFEGSSDFSVTPASSIYELGVCNNGFFEKVEDRESFETLHQARFNRNSCKKCSDCPNAANNHLCGEVVFLVVDCNKFHSVEHQPR